MNETDYENYCRDKSHSHEPAIGYFDDESISGSINADTINVLSGAELHIPLQNIEELQKECPDINRIKAYLTEGTLPENDKLARRTIFEADHYFIQNDTLYHLYNRTPSKNSSVLYPLAEQLVIPESLRSEVIKRFHEDGHKNYDRTYHSIREKYYWTNLFADTKTYVKSCNFCQRVNPSTHPKKAYLKPWEIEGPWIRVHCDTAGPLPEDENHNRHILIVIDSFSRWVELIPLKTIEAKEIAEKIYTECISRYGVFKTLVSDRGTSFLSKVMERLCELCKIKRGRTIPYHPQSNSAAENFNRFIWKNLKRYCQDDNKSWASYLSTIACAHRSTVSIYSTKFSPFELFTGRKINLPLDSMIQFTPTEGSGDANLYMSTLEERVKLLHEIATENIRESQKHYKEQYDKNAQSYAYPVDKILWMFSPTQLKTGTSKKMLIKYNRLVKIKEKIGENTYTVVDAKSGEELKFPVHVDNLREYIPEIDNNSGGFAAKPAEPDQSISNDKMKQSVTKDKNPKHLQKNVPNTHDKDEGKLDIHTNDGDSSRTVENISRPSTNLSLPSQETDTINIRKLWDEDQKTREAIEAILQSKQSNDKQYYLIQWKDENKDFTWEVADSIPEDMTKDFDKHFYPSGRRKRSVISLVDNYCEQEVNLIN
jgi:transposase InsO family protein